MLELLKNKTILSILEQSLLFKIKKILDFSLNNNNKAVNIVKKIVCASLFLKISITKITIVLKENLRRFINMNPEMDQRNISNCPGESMKI
mmetsp:Transcript_9679/g.23820  ORF Transcript_9679/g.23820 Transcript_9679/m.23820 type:complete len:91 (+) Transcript_9679:1342-1614(+)